MAGPLGMADDLSETRPWGERLRTWREDVKHWSRAEFRDEVVAAAYRLGENRGQQLDERLIGRWESGDVLRPQSVYRRLLAHLGAPLPSSTKLLIVSCIMDPVEAWGLRTNLHMLCTELEDNMKRRVFVARSGPALAGLANPWLLDPVDRVVDRIDGRRIGHATVTDVETITAARQRMDDVLGGGTLLAAVREDLRVSINLVTRASYSAEVGRRLYSVVAEQARLASWFCFDTGRHGLAQHYTQMALRAAHSAEDRQVGANVLGFAALQAVLSGDGVAAEAFSRMTLAGGRGTLTPAVEAATYTRLGSARARLGDLPGAAAAFETAEGFLTASDPEAEPDWIYWFTADDLHGIVGYSYLFAHEPGTAIHHLTQAVDGTSEEFTRDRAFWLGKTATAQVLNGDLDESQHTADSALELLSGGLSSGLVVEVLTEFCGMLRARDPRAATDVEERLAAYARTPRQA
jgi:hypothetical protein